MGDVISENYSILNSYEDIKNNFFYEALNWFSTPCRRVLGGRNVFVIPQTSEKPLSTGWRVATVFFSVIIFPVAVVSIASLILKLATIPYLWEKKKVQVQSRESWKVINAFNDAFKKGDYDKAIKAFKTRPGIEARSDVDSNLFKIINHKINANTSWKELEKLLPYLSIKDGTALIDHAVKVKLEKELKDYSPLINANDIASFIKNSIRYRSAKNIEACYKKLFSSSLKIDLKEKNVIVTAVKMEIVDNLLKSLSQIKSANANSELERNQEKIDAYLLRSSILDKKDDNYLQYCSVFESAEDMEKIGRGVQSLRDLYKISSESMKEMNAILSKKNLSFSDKLKHIRSGMVVLQRKFKSLCSSAEEDEKKFLQSTQQVLQTFISLIDDTLREASQSKMDEAVKNIKSKLEDELADMKKLFGSSKVSYTQTVTENLLAVLALQRRSTCIILSSKIKAFFVKSVLQAATH